MEIVTGYTIARSIPFRIQSLLSNDTTAEGNTEKSCFLLLHGIIYAEEDFIEVVEELQFEIGTQGQPICITVHPQNDTILETDEYFHLEIVASPPVNNSLSVRSVTSVIILDDDSEILKLCAQLCLIVFI